MSLAKVIYGYMTNSIAMTSDGFHSFFDGVSNIVGLIGIWIAYHPPDENHPYGHRKVRDPVHYNHQRDDICLPVFKFSNRFIIRLLNIMIQSYLNKLCRNVVTMAVNISVAIYERKKG